MALEVAKMEEKLWTEMELAAAEAALCRDTLEKLLW